MIRVLLEVGKCEHKKCVEHWTLGAERVDHLEGQSRAERRRRTRATIESNISFFVCGERNSSIVLKFLNSPRRSMECWLALTRQ